MAHAAIRWTEGYEGENDCAHEWRDGEMFCEDCGDHPAVFCTKCDGGLDTVFMDDPREQS